MKILKFVMSAVTVIALVGCAHPLVLTPDISKIERPSPGAPIKKNVAYFIADEQRNREVTTPGGGGDRISYHPYRDVEIAFYKMLGNVFADVVKVSSADNAKAISNGGPAYLITPEIVTNSSSPSPFTWPPTNFSVDLTCNITNAAGALVLTKKVHGTGTAEYSDFKKDFALSGKVAMQDALLKMQQSLLDAEELRR
jgi:hypothetical protein